MKDFRDLKVWHKAHELTLSTYRASSGFPGEERFGLTSQIRRSVASIGSNIAEGCGYSSDKELARFLQIALGSASELQYQLLLAHDLELLDEEQHQRLAEEAIEVKKMLATLLKKLRAES